MSTPKAVAQEALERGQTLALIDQEMKAIEVLLSALHHIASGGKREAKRWDGLRAEPYHDESGAAGESAKEPTK